MYLSLIFDFTFSIFDFGMPESMTAPRQFDVNVNVKRRSLRDDVRGKLCISHYL